MASAMRSGSSHLISIIVDDLPNPHYSVLIDKIDYLLKKNGYDIMILCSHGKMEESLKMANLSISNLVNGIIYFPDSNDRSRHGTDKEKSYPAGPCRQSRPPVLKQMLSGWTTIRGERLRQSACIWQAIENFFISVGRKETAHSR